MTFPKKFPVRHANYLQIHLIAKWAIDWILLLRCYKFIEDHVFPTLTLANPPIVAEPRLKEDGRKYFAYFDIVSATKLNSQSGLFLQIEVIQLYTIHNLFRW